MKLPTWHLLLWMLLGWSIPAVLAHAIGWHAIWGSGSVALDYLLPIPVAAGVLHVPSFVLCTIGLWQLPTVSAKTSGRLRAAAWGLALASGLGLLRLDEALIAVRSGGAWSGTLWQENPLALFVLTDAGLALLMSVGVTRFAGCCGFARGWGCWCWPGKWHQRQTPFFRVQFVRVWREVMNSGWSIQGKTSKPLNFSRKRPFGHNNGIVLVWVLVATWPFFSAKAGMQ